MATIKNPEQLCPCGCGVTRGEFINALLRADVDVDTAARAWQAQCDAITRGRLWRFWLYCLHRIGLGNQ